MFACVYTDHSHSPVCQEVAGEPLYMLYRAIKYQVDKGPVDSVTGKAKRTLNDSHLLREDIDYCAMVTTATHTHLTCVLFIHTHLDSICTS